MRKRIINLTQSQATTSSIEQQWLDLEKIAQVEVTSENPEHTIEKALLLDEQIGWRATQKGEQIIRLIFDQPQNINHIVLQFVELQIERTQEFVLRWSNDKGKTFKEIVRQQWNFNSGSTEENEDYRVNLTDLTLLELAIIPDISGGQAYASLQKLRLA